MRVALLPVESELPAGFAILRSEASAEGCTNMERLAAEWHSGANRFDRAGETLLAAQCGERLAGIGGMNIDPVDFSALRLRRFYVATAFRRRGIARRLADALITSAREITDHVVLNAETELAVRFWEAIGFVPDHRDGHSHVLRWSAWL